MEKEKITKKEIILDNLIIFLATLVYIWGSCYSFEHRSETFWKVSFWFYLGAIIFTTAVFILYNYVVIRRFKQQIEEEEKNKEKF